MSRTALSAVIQLVLELRRNRLGCTSIGIYLYIGPGFRNVAAVHLCVVDRAGVGVGWLSRCLISGIAGGSLFDVIQRVLRRRHGTAGDRRGVQPLCGHTG